MTSIAFTKNNLRCFIDQNSKTKIIKLLNANKGILSRHWGRQTFLRIIRALTRLDKRINYISSNLQTFAY